MVVISGLRGFPVNVPLNPGSSSVPTRPANVILPNHNIFSSCGGAPAGRTVSDEDAVDVLLRPRMLWPLPETTLSGSGIGGGGYGAGPGPVQKKNSGKAGRQFIFMVGDIKNLCRCFPADGIDQIDYHTAVSRVQTLAGFIQNQHFRIFNHGPGDQHQPFFSIGQPGENRCGLFFASPKSQASRRRCLPVPSRETDRVPPNRKSRIAPHPLR